MRYLLSIIFTLFLLSGIILNATIVNTKHNLSTSSTATTKAQVETEVCAFCHIPHNAQVDAKPLWNRSMPTSVYTMYDSDYLRRMDYPAVALDLGTTVDTPGALSRQCMSCHDGTVAIGSVNIIHGTFMGSDQIAMDGVEADGTMSTTAAGYIGTDLSKHHPIGIEYDSTIFKNFDVGTRTMELKATLATDAQVKLFEYGGKKYVECSSCHDPHKENSKFLRVDKGANHAQNVAATCTACHEKTDWSGSIHQSPPSTALYTDAGVQSLYGTDKVADLGCANCHTPHNGEGVPYLNRKVLGQTCFQGAASDVAGAACHGVGGAKDIESVLTRAYTHPVVASSNPDDPKHTNLDSLYGTGNLDPLGIEGMNWDINKHAVCMDCHNPHRAKAGTHIIDGSWYGPPGASTNLVSNVLQGVPGIEPVWPSEWMQPKTFTTLESSEKEYQICFKCHSYWGIGNATDGVNDSGYVSPSDGVTPLTDVAWEMNINNKSGHPVVINQNARTGSYDSSATDGSTGLRSLQPNQLLSPWTENPGLNTMYCSDCHGADNELGGDPKGPHGSNLKFILKGENQSWPYKPDGVTLYTMADLQAGTYDDLFCANCHNPEVPHTYWRNKMSRRRYACVECHVAVPHGSSNSRLIGYSSFPAPYNFNGNSLKIQGYRKNLTVEPLDVWASESGSCNGRRCHRTNDSANGAYDQNLVP